MIKLKNNTLTREALPVFLLGLQTESLRDLSWTDPALGVSDCAWLPEVDQSPSLKQYERYGAETLTLGDDVAIVTRPVVPWSEAEIAVDIKSKAAVKVEAIKAERDRRKFNGTKVGTKWIHTDTYSRTQWMAMVMMGASIPAISWTTMDGTSVTTSQTLAGQVFQGTAQLDAQLFGFAKTLITQVEAAADPSAVDIVNGWPATYEAA